jgi:hypothetical protein
VNASGSALTLKNSIVANSFFYSDHAPDCVNSGGTVTVSYSLIEDGSCGITSGVNGNRTGDPSLGALTGNPAYHPLLLVNGATNVGSNALLPADTTDLDGDGNTTEALPIDQRGSSRIVDGTVDMGSYEVDNTRPTISDITSTTTNEDTPTSAIAFTVGDAETAAANLTVSGSSSHTTIVPDTNIVFGGSGANRTVTITPAAHHNGTATITITVDDGNGGAATDTFLLDSGQRRADD